MIDSYDVDVFGIHKIDGVVRIRKNGTICIYYKDERGLPVNNMIRPEQDTRKYGLFVKLPVVSKKNGKRQFIEVDLIDIYRKYFSEEELPEPLKVIEASQQAKGKLINEFNQIELL
jgi:malate/lactate dehydrogenase